MSGFIVDLDTQLFVAPGTLTLNDVVERINEWPSDATCATQDSDGGVLYWNAPVEEVIAGRLRAGDGDMMREIGLGAQVHCAYLDVDSPVVAKDWNTAVAINPARNTPSLKEQKA